MNDLAQKTAWVGTDLDSKETQWVAFPVIKLDGDTPNIIIRAKDFEIVYTSTNGRESYGVMPREGLYLLKKPKLSEEDTKNGA